MAQSATISSTKARILAIAALNTDIETAGGLGFGADGDYLSNGKLAPFTDDMLPAVVVRHAGTAGRVRMSLGKLRVTRRYNVFVFVARSDAKTDEAELDAIHAAEALLDSLPVTFLARPTLHLVSAADAIALASSPMTDEGAAIQPYGGVDFGAIKYSFTVETVESG